MPIFRAQNKLDRAFEISLLLKGLDGLLETLSGLMFLFIKPSWILDVAHGIVGYQPHSFIGKHILEAAQHFNKGAAIFASLYLLSHGVVKLVLIIAILREQAWAYIGLIVVTALFMVYQIYHLIFVSVTFTFIFLTLFDGVVVYLTAREYKRQKVHFAHRHHHPEPETD